MEKHTKMITLRKELKKMDRIENIYSVADLAKEFSKLQLLLEKQQTRNYFCNFCGTDTHPKGKCPDIECYTVTSKTAPMFAFFELESHYLWIGKSYGIEIWRVDGPMYVVFWEQI